MREKHVAAPNFDAIAVNFLAIRRKDNDLIDNLVIDLENITQIDDPKKLLDQSYLDEKLPKLKSDFALKDPNNLIKNDCLGIENLTKSRTFVIKQRGSTMILFDGKDIWHSNLLLDQTKWNSLLERDLALIVKMNGTVEDVKCYRKKNTNETIYNNGLAKEKFRYKMKKMINPQIFLIYAFFICQFISVLPKAYSSFDAYSDNTTDFTLLSNVLGNEGHNIDIEKLKVRRRSISNAEPIDYKSSHPFEIMKKHRQLHLQRQLNLKKNVKRRKHNSQQPPFSYNSTNVYPSSYDIDQLALEPSIQTPGALSAFLTNIAQFDTNPNDQKTHPLIPLTYQPIRITTELFLPSSNIKNGGRTIAWRNDLLQYTVMPKAIEYWVNTLKLIQIQSPYIIPSQACPLSNEDDIVNSDLHLYVVGTLRCNGANVLASASSCHYDQYDRPIAGTIQFCYNSLPSSPTAQKDSLVNTAIHELSHILGFKDTDFAYFYEIETGRPRTPRFSLDDANSISESTAYDTDINKNNENNTFVNVIKAKSCVDGSTIPHTLIPSETTLQQEIIGNDIENNKASITNYYIVTPKVSQVVRNHFNCQSLLGARLENQPTGNSCFGDHWDERLFMNSVMSSGLTDEASMEYITPLTLALLEDSGWYIANYSLSSISPFGHGAGCEFAQKPCIVNGNVPDYSRGTFCNSTSSDNDIACDPTHHFIAICDLMDYSRSNNDGPGFGMQYFPNKNLGAKFSRADFCPTYTENLASCTKTFRGRKMWEGEEFGLQSSRCFLTNNLRPYCLDTRCNKEKGVIEILQQGRVFNVCQFDGQQINIDGTLVECPKFAAICPDMVCPRNCEGKTICNFDLDQPMCDESFPSVIQRNRSSNAPSNEPFLLVQNTSFSPSSSEYLEKKNKSPIPTNHPSSFPFVGKSGGPTIEPSYKPTIQSNSPTNISSNTPSYVIHNTLSLSPTSSKNLKQKTNISSSPTKDISSFPFLGKDGSSTIKPSYETIVRSKSPNNIPSNTPSIVIQNISTLSPTSSENLNWKTNVSPTSTKYTSFFPSFDTSSGLTIEPTYEPTKFIIPDTSLLVQCTPSSFFSKSPDNFKKDKRPRPFSKPTTHQMKSNSVVSITFKPCYASKRKASKKSKQKQSKNSKNENEFDVRKKRRKRASDKK